MNKDVTLDDLCYYLYTFDSNKEVLELKKYIEDHPDEFSENDFFGNRGMRQMYLVQKALGNKWYEGWSEEDKITDDKMSDYMDHLRTDCGYVYFDSLASDRRHWVTLSDFMNADLTDAKGMYFLFSER
jgi:hypothetical protein